MRAVSLRKASGWSVPSDSGPVEAREVVVALGPWSDDVFLPLGYDIPLAVKRGYHMHYGVTGNATLGHPLHDGDGGYMLVPMTKGIRLTTGVEFAERDAPPTRCNWLAMNSRPRIVSARGTVGAGAVDGKAPLPSRYGPGDRARRAPPGLWFAFGHAHHGFTLGPVTGRLLAEMMTGETPFADPSPYAAGRFGH